jgi:hypothetical protein
MPSDYSDEHIKQMTDPNHDQSAFKKPKIFESPDGGKTVYEREFNSPHSSRKLTTGEKLYGYHPQELLTKKILPPDVFYKLFGQSK